MNMSIGTAQKTEEHRPWLATLPVAAALLSAQGLVLEGNAIFWQLITGNSAAGAADSLNTHADSSILSMLRRHLAAAKSFSLELELHDANGAQRWLQCTGAPAAQSEQAAGHLCFFHDITAGRMAELAAKTQAAQLRLLADNVPAAIAYYKAEGFKCIFANRQYTRMFGQTEESIVGMTFAQIIGEEATRLIQPMVDKLLNEGIAANYVRALNSPDGQTVRWLEVSLIPQFGELGQVIAAFVLISDITKHRLAEQAVRDSEQRLMAFMNASAEGIVIHQNGRIIDVNPALCELINLRHDELVGRDGMSFVPLEYRAEIVANVSAQRNARYESMVMDREGVHIPVEFIGRTVDYRGTPARMSIVRDLRDRKAAQERINYLAHHDDMTGLYNRTQFLSLLDTALEGRRARSKHAALLFIDLDNFKRVNDTHGHRAGDELLKEIAKRLKRVFRESDIVARYAGDEFIVLLQEVQSLPEVSGMAQRLIEVVSEPFSYDTHQLEVSASVGIAVFPDDASVAEDLIAHADTAAYNAKHGGGAQYAFYSHIDIDSWHI